ncbi:MAG: sugar-binding protein [bacterium]|jgi:hypothetical protein|nr:sugar-binding protein [bacterium]
MNRIILVLGLAMLTFGLSFAAVDQRVDICNFEADEDLGIQITGSTIVESGVFSPADDGIPLHEGEFGLYGWFDSSQGEWTQTTLTFPTAIDLTGMRELHFWIYFFSDAKMHRDGNFRFRVYGPHNNLFGIPQVSQAGVWTEIVLPIDRAASDSELTSVNQLRFVWNPGDNATEGRFYIDEIYGFHPGDTPAVQDVMIYGFNQADPATGYPVGWQARSDSVGLMMGDAFVQPSEGSDYMESIMPGGWKRPMETINAARDFDQWDRVLDVTVDARISEDNSQSWHDFLLVLESSSGGYYQYEIKGVMNKDSWRRVTWDVDITPHLGSIADPNGWFRLSFITQTGEPAVGSVFIDNLRVGIATDYVGGSRVVDARYFQAGDAIPVTLNLEAEGTVKDYTVSETLPTGWSASEISDGGQFANGKITWTVSMGNGQTQKSLTYTATAPDNATVDAAWSGSIGGQNLRGKSTLFFLSDSLWENRILAPFTPTAPVVMDGKISAGEYENAYVENVFMEGSTDKTPPGVYIDGTAYTKEQSNFTIHILHDSEAIYVAVDVVDNNLAFDEVATETWNNDCTELFLDGNLSRNPKPKENGPYGFQASVVGSGRLAGGNNAPTAIVESAEYGYSTDGQYWNFATRVKDDDSGWVIEYKIDKSKVLNPLDSNLVGFDLKMDLSEVGAGTRVSNWGYWFTNSAGVVADGYWDDETGWALMELQEGDSSINTWNLF